MKKLILLSVASLAFACSKQAVDLTYTADSTAEAGQQVGDAMVSVDESGGSSSGAIAQFDFSADQKTFARLSHNSVRQEPILLKIIFPEAHAAACSTVAFSACSSGQRVRDLNSCTTALNGVMSGNVTLTFSGSGVATCTIPAASDAVSRVPNYSVTGLRGATFAVAATSTGQTVTRTGATTFTFANAGIRRSFTTPKGVVILDLTTTTASPITVTGNSRTSRTMTGGGLTILNNLTGVSCPLVPSSVTWTAGCNCPTSGSWGGTCSDSTTMNVAFSATCGAATVTKGTETSTITMDRCQ